MLTPGESAFSSQIMEQEKYALKKKLNSIEIEYENKIQELQADLQAVREKLNVHFEINRENDTENSRLIEELTRQNQRLTEELKIVSKVKNYCLLLITPYCPRSHRVDLESRITVGEGNSISEGTIPCPKDELHRPHRTIGGAS